MNEAQQTDAAAPLSDQPAAAHQRAAPAAAGAAALSINPASAVDAAPMLSRPWMETDGEDASLLADPRGAGGEERRGSRSRSQSVARIRSAAVRPAAAAAVAAAPSASSPAWRAAHADGSQEPAAAAAAAPAASDSSSASRARAAQHARAQQTAPSAKRPREEADSDDELEHARDELQRQRRRRAQSGRAAAASASDAAAARRSRPSGAAVSPPLFSELPHQIHPGHRTASLRVDSLPQEWFMDEVPDDLICSVCLDVARDPPNLEACGQSHSRTPLCQQLSADAWSMHGRLTCACHHCWSLCRLFRPRRLPRVSDAAPTPIVHLPSLPPVVPAFEAGIAALRPVDGVADARAMRAARQGLRLAGSAGHGDERAQGARPRVPIQGGHLCGLRQQVSGQGHAGSPSQLPEPSAWHCTRMRLLSLSQSSRRLLVANLFSSANAAPVSKF